jgi:hypothetical protein
VATVLAGFESHGYVLTVSSQDKEDNLLSIDMIAL